MELAQRFREGREDDLDLHANAFRRPLEKMTGMQRRVCDALATTGPLAPRWIAARIRPQRHLTLARGDAR